MSINVTPIPRLIELASPSFTLGTANAAGSAVTSVRSDATLLMFDTTVPAAVAAASAAGSATVTARRDHVHAGTAGAGTVVDEAIARFDGTGGASLQGYSSLSPTISNAGIISLTSGALKFPATVISSSEPNTLYDYEMGTWTPSIADSSHDGTKASYSVQSGRYEKIGKTVFYQGSITVTSLGTMTTSDNCTLEGLPFTNLSGTPGQCGFYIGYAVGLAITSGTTVTGYQSDASTYINLVNWDGTSGTSALLVSEYSASGRLFFSGKYEVA